MKAEERREFVGCEKWSNDSEVEQSSELKKQELQNSDSDISVDICYF